MRPSPTTRPWEGSRANRSEDLLLYLQPIQGLVPMASGPNKSLQPKTCGVGRESRNGKNRTGLGIAAVPLAALRIYRISV